MLWCNYQYYQGDVLHSLMTNDNAELIVDARGRVVLLELVRNDEIK